MTPYKPRVLVLETDPEFRTLLRLFFEEHDLSVDCAFDDEEAAVLIGARPYELVLDSTADDEAAARIAEVVRSTHQRAALVRLAASPHISRAVHLVIDRLKAVRHLNAFVHSARELMGSPKPVAV
jgi:DNA-binding response OmpR family regulator